jgi:hypothetical protein
MAKPVATPAAAAEGQEVLTPLQKILAGTLVLSFITVPIFSFVFYLAPFYKAPGAAYRGEYWLIGGALAIVLSAAFSWFWMTRLPGLLEARQKKRVERAAVQREERRVEKRKEQEQLRSDRAAAKSAALADEEE